MKTKLNTRSLLLLMGLSITVGEARADAVEKLTVIAGDFNINHPGQPNDGLNDWAGDLLMNTSGVLIPYAFNATY